MGPVPRLIAMTPTVALASAIAVIIGHASFAAAFVARPSLPSSPSPPSPTWPAMTTPAVRTTSLPAVKEATFGMGCFWEPAESLLQQPGVLATTVGYTGAPPNKPPPTYDTVCFGREWVEAVRVAYDDDTCSYEELLDSFFRLQKPGVARQYASVIFVEGAQEEQRAKKWKQSSTGEQPREDNLSYDIVEIEPSSSFYKAEEYHQRYWEKQRLRGLIAIALIAGESGAYDDFLGGVVGKTELFGFSIDTVCGGAFLVGAAWMLLERAVARDVRELGPGDLTAMIEKN